VVDFVARLESRSRSNLRTLTFPAYLSVDFTSESRSIAAGMGATKVIRATLLSPTAMAADSVGYPVLVAVLTSDAVLTAVVGSETGIAPGETVEMVAVLTSETALVASALELTLLGAVLASRGEMLAEMQPSLPPIREPAWDELRGTVNLVRNASVENTDIGLLDWYAFGGVTLALDDTLAWHQTRSVEVTFPSSGADAGFGVRTQGGLGITDTLGVLMVGSLSLLGEITQIRVRMQATYSDATTDDILDDAFDLATTDDEWARVRSLSLELDPTKVLDFLALEVVHPTPDVESIMHADGVQIEQDRGDSATPFAQGDMGDGYAWLGLPGISMSLRETSQAAV
jgi:hypothetical protein